MMKLFIVLYHALKRGRLSWMLCLDRSVTVLFQSLQKQRRARMREPQS